ncbi:hypothetical protein GIB67_018856 [Kingdonia uniflora]|uniref:Uncharacterized protein n=1 Tax=Kingdonia uniflora TaxID=39325 RepID=A0A7J7NEL3_9MAGN|nr:hypothetical protein GIB67_018856 [Kingdonia uniflora]
MLGRYHIGYHTIETITWEPWLESAVSEIEEVLTAKLISRKRMPLQVPNRNCEYYLRDRCWRQLTGEARIPLDPLLNMSPHIHPAALQEMRQARFLDYLLGPTALRADITPVVVTSASVHSLSQDFKSARDAQRLQQLTDKNDTLRHLDSVDDQLHAHNQHLRRGHDVRVVPLLPGGGARMRQRGSSLRTRGGGTSRRGWGTGDDSE